MNRKIIIGIGFTLMRIIFCQFGFFNRFNNLTAKIDSFRNSARIVITEILLHPCVVPCIGLKEKYGFHEHFSGCNLTKSTIRGIESYNT